MAPPPPNGKKLWRVQRQPSTGGQSSNEHNATQECFQNSLKIAAAGKAYSTKRPPLKRPKNQPGKPKDFVFVDLSPVRTEEAESTTLKKQKCLSISANDTPTTNFENISPYSEASQDSFSVSSDEESLFSLYDNSSSSQQPNYQNASLPEVGLGINLLEDWQFDYQQTFNSYPQPEHKRSESTPYIPTCQSFETPNRKRSASVSFDYKTPSPKKQNTQGLEAFMMFNDQFNITLPEESPKFNSYNIPRSVNAAADAYHESVNSMPYTPVSCDSDIEDLNNMKLGKPIDFSTCYDSRNLLQKHDFDLSAFVAF